MLDVQPLLPNLERHISLSCQRVAQRAGYFAWDTFRAYLGSKSTSILRVRLAVISR